MAKSVKRKAKIKTYPFDAAETLDTPEAIEEFLIAALETGDAAFIAKSIGTAARAVGMSKIAKKAGLSRENLLSVAQRQNQGGARNRRADALGTWHRAHCQAEGRVTSHLSLSTERL